MLSHSVGALPVGARQAANEFFASWAEVGGDAWGSWLGAVEGFRVALAALFGGRPDEYCPQSNVTAGVVKLLHGTSPRPGRNRIWIGGLDFPSIGFAAQKLAPRGWRVDALPARPGPASFPIEAWDACLTPEVDWVVVSHALYGNGWLNPVAEIAALARSRGVRVLVDVAQSAGVVPFSVRAWDVEAVSGSCIKWLCGGPGAGFLWVNPAFLEQAQPEDVGWFSHENPFELELSNFRYAPDARRFWGGTPSVLPCVVATAGLRLLADAGIETARRHNRELTERLLEAARKLGIPSATPADPESRGGTVVLAPPDPAGLLAVLHHHGVRCDVPRNGFGIRLSPHLYTSAAEIDAVCSLLGLPMDSRTTP